MTATTPLWKRPDFARFWAAQTISDFGARITREGLPIMAVTALAATPGQLGVLAAVTAAPAVLVGLSAGGFVDRARRRRVMILTDVVRVAALIALPLAAIAGVLSIWHVFAAAAVVAAATSLFDLADHAYLPTLVSREELADGNAKMSGTEALAEIGGPALAGMLFQWLTAPIAVAVNALTYVASALFLGAIKVKEQPAPTTPEERGWLAGLRAGLAAAWREPTMRTFFVTGGVSALFGGIFSALYVVFALKTLGLSTAQLGLAIAAGGIGALAGSALAQPVARLFGWGPAFIGATALSAVSVVMIPLAPADPNAGFAVLVAAQLLGDSSGVVSLILAVSLRQALTPQALLGRVGAAFQLVLGSAAVAGALAGGALAHAAGVREALYVAAAGFAIIPLAALGSPLRGLREMPA